MIEKLDETNFVLYAAKHYDNPECFETLEFYDDVAKIKYIKRLFNKYIESGELRERLILNHLIVLFNVFGAEPAQRLLFFKLKDHYVYLKTFLTFLNLCPKVVENIGLRGEDIDVEKIPIDFEIMSRLRKL